MGKTRLVTIVSIITIAAIAVTTLPVAKASSCCPGGGQKPVMDMEKPVMTKTLSLEKIHSGYLPMVSMSIDKALMAIKLDDKKTALAELNKVKKMLAIIKEGIGKLVKPKFANVRCPIMGSPINPEKVANDLIREYKGQKVAFCCGGCPAAWEKLTYAEKNAKLSKVKPTLQKVWTCSMHPQIKLPKPGLCPICNMNLIPVSTQ